FSISYERFFGAVNSGTTFGGNLDYNWINRYWFWPMAKYVSQQDGQIAAYNDAFFCPDDDVYTAKASELRSHEETIWQRCSYLMSDTALWDPKMFTDENITQILEEDQLRPEHGGPARADTPGRRYLPKSLVRFPESKVYIYEVN